MNRSVLIAAAIALVAGLWIASGMFGGGEEPTAEASAATVEPGQGPKRVRVRDSVAQPMHATLNIYGQTKAPQEVTLKAETGGAVAKIMVPKGAVVSKDQDLIHLAAKDRPARLAEAKARVAQMALKYQQASRLARNDFASRTTVAEARANLEDAQASLAEIEQEIKDTVIRAPFAGVFDENTVEVGDVVSSGSDLGLLVRLNPMTVVAAVSERNLSKIDPAGEATVTLLSGEALKGRVSWIARVADSATRTYRVEVEIPNPDNSIAAGLTAGVALPLKAVTAHLVSPAMLTLDDQGRVGVKAVDADNTVVFYEVRPVEDGPQGMWLTGLPDHLRLITVGQDYVVVGGKAEPVPEGQSESEQQAAQPSDSGAAQ
jgi:multidrug efflux system membrane fusion protein